MKCRILSHVESHTGRQTKDKPMKNDIITLAAVLASIVAGAAFLLSSESPISVEAIVGYGSVFTLLAVAALDYRLSWK
jgi:hypothetical protein